MKRLLEFLGRYERLAVAFSGGVDSTLLLYAAERALGAERVLALIADTPFLPRSELDEAMWLAARSGVECRAVTLDVWSEPEIVANPPDRCYHCKKRIFTALCKVAADAGFNVLADGSNADDLGDDRPGHRAILELGVVSPLQECGLTKREIREISSELGLPTATKPAMACLATRIPSGEAITPDRLAQVEAAEEFLRELGFADCRVRRHGAVARIQVPSAALKDVLERREQVVNRFREIGFRWTALGLDEFCRG